MDKNSIFKVLREIDAKNGALAAEAKDKDEFYKIYEDRVMKMLEADPQLKLQLAWCFTGFMSAYSFEELKEWFKKTPKKDLLERITDLNTVLEFIEAPGVVLDVLYEVKTSKTKERINLDNQIIYSPLIEVVRRGLIYLAFSLVKEKGRDFTSTNYRDLVPVTGIWIYPLPSKALENNLYFYQFSGPSHLLGTQSGEDYLPEVNDMRLYELFLGPVGREIKVFGEISKERAEKLRIGMKLLNVIFSAQIPIKEKARILEEEFAFTGSDQFMEGVNAMFNIEESIIEGMHLAEKRAEKEAEAKMYRELEAKIHRELEAKIQRELEAKIQRELEAKMQREFEAKMQRELEQKEAILQRELEQKEEKEVNQRVAKEAEQKVEEAELKAKEASQRATKAEQKVRELEMELAKINSKK